MADENKPAFYPRVGNIKAKNFRSAQPAPFIDDPRAMELPVPADLSVPTKSNLDMSRRIAEREANLRQQAEADRSPLEKVAGALEAVRFMGSALTQSINSMPTRMVHGDEAAEKFMQERIYKPTQPTAYEYAQDIGDFLEKLETQYKLPPIATGEVLGFAPLIQAGVADAARKGTGAAVRGGMALEKAIDPMVTGALERGGLQRDLLTGLAQGTQSNVIKPKGGNWIGGSVEQALDHMLAKGLIANRGIPYGPEFDVAIRNRIKDLKEIASRPDHVGGAKKVAEHLEMELENPRTNEAAMNKWIQSNLTNYVKKEMGTPEDPVRKLAEQGISHLPKDLQNLDHMWTPDELAESRKSFGFPEEETATHPTAKMWEQMSDQMIGPHRASNIGGNLRAQNPWLEKLNPDEPVYKTMRGLPQALKFDHIIDVLRQDVAAGRIRPEQLSKVSMEQAVRRTAEFDEEMAKRMREAQLKQQEGFPVHKEYPEGYKWIELAKPEIATEIPPTHALEEYPSKLHGGVGYRVRNKETGMAGEGFKTPERATQEFLKSHAEDTLADALAYEGNTMGHCVGGYCPDVLKGNTRIFSLRDTKGEPHVTIEVQPNNYAPRWEAVKPYLEESKEQVIKDRMANNLPEATPDELEKLTQAYAYKKAKENQPANIVQIKGKQNAKPKEQYLPYVQDFVRGGDWADVGDFKNTGFDWHTTGPQGIFMQEDVKALEDAGHKVPKYLTTAEKDDLARKLYEMQTGNDYDTGLPKAQTPPPAEGMKRGGVAISNNPDTMMLELGNQKMKNGVPAYGGAGAVLKEGLKAAKPEIMKASEALGKIEGRPLLITQADRTKVGGGFLGGPGFSGLQLTDPAYRAAEAAWAVKNPGTANTILGGNRAAGKDAVFAAMLGSPTQHQSNQMVFDKMYGEFKKAAKRGELDPELRDKINLRLASAVDKDGNPVFPADIDILDKNFKKIADTFDRRSIAGHLMGGVQVGGKKGQIIDYDKIIKSTTDPLLVDAPSGAIGNRLFTLSGGVIERPDLHPAFPTILQGEDLGVSFDPVTRDLIMKDFIEKTQREKGRAPGYMDYIRGYPPSQLITEDLLTELQKLGKKKGGAVYKAEGGAITGDDLIIEERPL